MGETSQLSFYDFEPNVIPPNPDAPERGRASVQPPLRRRRSPRRSEKPECFEKGGEPLCTHDGQFYLFDENTLEPLAGPVTLEEDLYLKFDGEQPEGSVVEEVPQGYVVLREEAPRRRPGDRSQRVARPAFAATSSCATAPS